MGRSRLLDVQQRSGAAERRVVVPPPQADQLDLDIVLGDRDLRALGRVGLEVGVLRVVPARGGRQCLGLLQPVRADQLPVWAGSGMVDAVGLA
ncbi:MAG: hypothetical protein JNM77_04420 [Pseudonocardia sp.]|nr:hypothetical protein [Pseudonocardia sp.]